MAKDYRALDPKLFKAFMAAAETGNFTTAAQRVHMTQSGVSQHISKLEKQIGMALFQREGKGATLTPAGKKLAQFVEHYAYSSEKFLDEVRQDRECLDGTLVLALPPSCVLTPQFALFLGRCAAHPGFRLHITVAPSAEIPRLLLNRSVDLGIVTETVALPGVACEPFFEEEYVYVTKGGGAEVPDAPDAPFNQRLVVYPGAEAHLRTWADHHMPEERQRLTRALASAARINSLAGALAMVTSGLCGGVFPRRCVERELATGALISCHASQEPLHQAVHLATVAGQTHRRILAQTITWLRESYHSGGGACSSAQPSSSIDSNHCGVRHG
jgi:DNA-binding transcriptional LysR family regulator